MKTANLQAVEVPLEDLKMAAYNPRKLSDKQLEGLVKSIKGFGFVEPIVANTKTGNIVGGHARLLAARKLGYVTVPVVWVSLDDKKEKALNVALNKQGGDFDNDMLAELLLELPDDLLDLTGFDDDFMADLQPSPLDLDEAEAPKEKTVGAKKYSTDELRTIAKSYYPEALQTITGFLAVVDERS